jgi:hypothetical protein
MSEALQSQIEKTIVQPVLKGMKAEGNPFRGFLYCGLMLTPDGPEGDRIQRQVWRSRSAGCPPLLGALSQLLRLKGWSQHRPP